MPESQDNPPKFEQAVADLEAIVDQIESGECGLEECIAQYERGMKLVGQCQAILNVVQQRIAELTADAGGKLQIKEGTLPVPPANGLGVPVAGDGDSIDAHLDGDAPEDDPQA